MEQAQNYQFKYLRGDVGGNNVGEEGFLWLTRRKFGQLQSLSLEQNGIKTLEGVPEENWRNLHTLARLSLSTFSIR